MACNGNRAFGVNVNEKRILFRMRVNLSRALERKRHL